MNIIQKLRDRETDTGKTNNRDFQAFEPFVERLELDIKLDGHEGCVNCIEFSQNGRILASASDDLCVFLWNPYLKKKITSFQTPHRGNIFSVNFLPKTNDQQIVTGAADKQIFVYDLKNTDEPIFRCRCPQGRVKRIVCAPEVPSTFFTSSEDGRVLQIDLRVKHGKNGIRTYDVHMFDCYDFLNSNNNNSNENVYDDSICKREFEWWKKWREINS